MNLETLIPSIPVQSIQGATNVEIRALAYDSRRVQPGGMFVALPGLKEDGARYMGDAVERGAVAVVSQQGARAPRGITHIRVEDARRALAEMACVFHGRPSEHMAVAGVTGTNGKTTVSFMLRDILRKAGHTPGMVGSVVYEMGQRVIPASRTTPESTDLQDMFAQMLRPGCRSAVIEVSSHALDQKRVWGVAFDVAVFTNLTHDHLDYHGSMEVYFESKTRLLEQLGQGNKPGTAVVNLDDPWSRRWVGREKAGVRMLTFGVDPSADIRAEHMELEPDGTRLVLRTPEESVSVRWPLIGPFNISNALAAIGAARALQVPLETSLSVLEQFTAAPGRLEPVDFRPGIRVLVDYAHTDDALNHVLNALRATLSGGRIILVFGCGGNRDRAKRPRMGAAAARGADRTILTNDNPREEDPETIIEEIAGGFGADASYEKIPDREQAIHAALDRAEPGDVVLIAGKGHENFQEFQRTVIPFDDRQVVRAYAANRS